MDNLKNKPETDLDSAKGCIKGILLGLTFWLLAGILWLYLKQ
jgi:hypothetical protein